MKNKSQSVDERHPYSLARNLPVSPTSRRLRGLHWIKETKTRVSYLPGRHSHNLPHPSPAVVPGVSVLILHAITECCYQRRYGAAARNLYGCAWKTVPPAKDGPVVARYDMNHKGGGGGKPMKENRELSLDTGYTAVKIVHASRFAWRSVSSRPVSRSLTTRSPRLENLLWLYSPFI